MAQLWRMKNKDKLKKYNQSYYSEHSKEMIRSNAIRGKERIAILKDKIYKILGKKCKSCDTEDKRVLQIDHVHGNGLKEIRSFSNQEVYLKHVLKRLEEGHQGYQILCSNCNIIKYKSKSSGTSMI